MSHLPIKKTKILATIGPASNSYEMIKSLAFAGANVFRLNFSHGSHEVHKEVLETIRKVNQEMNCHLGILQDLQGPKIRVGEVENTRLPVPVSSVTAAMRFAELGVASHVATPVPRPDIPPTGRPVQFVSTPLVGVPRRGVTRVGLVAKTADPDPVSSVIAALRFPDVGLVRKVETPVPSPVTPPIGRPVQFVRVPLVGVPSTGETKVGVLANTRAPEPVSSDMTPASCNEVVAAN
jgi:hypothetical protein